MIQPELLAEYKFTSNIIRGIIIGATTALERAIDVYLSNHFAQTKEAREELVECVFATKYITFENKRMIFDHIITTHNKGNKDKKFAGFHSKLDAYNRHRNIVAHSVIDGAAASIEHFKNTGEISYLKFEKSVKSIKYSIKQAEEIATDIINWIAPVVEIIKE